MTLRNQVLIWVGVAVVSLIVIWTFRGILLPFVIGLALAYVLNPVVGLVEKTKLNRAWSTAVVLFIVLAIIVGIMVLILPLVVQQLIGLLFRLPGYVNSLRSLANQWVPALNEWLGAERVAQFETSLTDWLNNLPGITANVTAYIAQSGLTFISGLAIVIVTPVVAFYLLLDWQGMVEGIDRLLPLDHKHEVRQILNEIDQSMAGVVRGQGSVVLFLTLYYATALSISGISFGLAIGLITGLISFIPFIGFLVGFILSMIIATVQFWPNWPLILLVFLIFMVGQFLEGNVLYPKLVGSSIGINPVWLMFSLFAFSSLFGFVGLLLAVPLSAIAGVLTRFSVQKYKQSQLYLGQNGATSVNHNAAD
ncbi:MAG TPA: AI-2E family transporter [Devosiaceae bacterium]|jgi:predicted PurR-regulated permease PerM|nr:AI-2E family transporter [Devosiaceae bacterium]